MEMSVLLSNLRGVHMGVSTNGGIQNGWCIREHTIKMDDLVVNHHILWYIPVESMGLGLSKNGYPEVYRSIFGSQLKYSNRFRGIPGTPTVCWAANLSSSLLPRVERLAVSDLDHELVLILCNHVLADFFQPASATKNFDTVFTHGTHCHTSVPRKNWMLT